MSATKIEDDTKTTNCLGKPHTLILFNDNHHSFEQVMMQVMATINCPPSTAEKIVMTAHNSGQAIVFTGSLETCELKEAILSGPPASLRTAVEPA